MDTKTLLKKYHARLATESWIQSALWGLIIGFCLNIICSVTFLFLGIKMFWISILVFLAGAGIATPLFYFKKFRRSNRQVASRVDALGLEERILTMAQFENDDSFMARRQREDAMAALKSVNESLIKIAVSVPLVIACVLTFAVGVGTTTVSAMAEKSLLEVIDEQKQNKPEDPVFFEVSYEVLDDEGGRIDGELFQIIAGGCDAEAVQAVADDGYVFVGWSDGVENDYRMDVDVSENITVYAQFVAIEDGDENESDDDDGEEGSGKAPSQGKEQQQPGDKPSDPGNGGGEGGSSEPNNQIIDGSTFYGDEYGSSLTDAQGAMESGSDMTGDDVGVIGDYFHNIAK